MRPLGYFSCSQATMSLQIDVGLVSGRTVSLQVEPDASVASLSQSAQTALGVGKGRLLGSSVPYFNAYWYLFSTGVIMKKHICFLPDPKTPKP